MAPELTAALREARARWPSVPFDAEPFEQFVGARAAQQPTALADLALVEACCRGVPNALAALERELRNEVTLVVGRQGPVDDLVQRLMTKLLVGAPRRLSSFSGRGSLGGWLRAATVREHLNLQRGAMQGATISDDEGLARAEAPSVPVDLQVLEARHAEVFKTAFRAALDALEPRERDLVRLHLLENVSLVELSSRWSVHRTTLARWLDIARHRIVEKTREHLTRTLQLSRQESDSLTGFLSERVDVSLTGLRAG